MTQSSSPASVLAFWLKLKEKITWITSTAREQKLLDGMNKNVPWA